MSFGSHSKNLILQEPQLDSVFPWTKCTYERSVEGLQKELEDFLLWVNLSPEESSMRWNIVTSISTLVSKMWPDAQMEIVGSLKTDLCIPTSDIDVVIQRSPFDLASLFQLASALEKGRLTKQCQVITTAKVPIIKFQEFKSKLSTDIAFNVTTSSENTKIIQSFLDQEPQLRSLVLILKCFLSQRSLNEPWCGGLGSYSLVVLVVSFLKYFDVKNSGLLLSELLIGFFFYYGFEFNYRDHVISVLDEGAKILEKKEKNWFNESQPDHISIEDPHNPEKDLGLLSFNYEHTRQAFKDGYTILTTELQKEENSTNSILYNLFPLSHSVQLYRMHVRDAFYSRGPKKYNPYHRAGKQNHNSSSHSHSSSSHHRSDSSLYSTKDMTRVPPKRELRSVTSQQLNKDNQKSKKSKPSSSTTTKSEKIPSSNSSSSSSASTSSSSSSTSTESTSESEDIQRSIYSTRI
eukprot:TRINITY_DN731_c1_g3_i1.p1 TRINITY_DN731_c1_g3~~TRINITY_DN731_c1_g3_i1.p1  ORF type:complete len:462 (-),score=85.52 TRINITY_DN731_c1_g3_i1:706-2091(-)